MIKIFTSILILLLFTNKSSTFGQDAINRFKKSNYIDAIKVDHIDLINLAKQSDKSYTIFYTFTSWCQPCRETLPYALALEELGNVNVYIILLESEKDKRISKAIDFIKSKTDSPNYIILKDEHYGNKTKQRTKTFIKEMTPPHIEYLPSFSQFILLNKLGEVLTVTNYKDDYLSKDKKVMLDKTIIPLLK